MPRESVPQTRYQPPVPSSRALARHDGVSVGTGANYVIYTAPARTKAVIRWLSFTNRASSSTPTYVQFFVTASDGTSPRILRHLFAVDDVAQIVSGADELVLMEGDKIEAIAEVRTVTADIFVSGYVEFSAS